MLVLFFFKKRKKISYENTNRLAQFLSCVYFVKWLGTDKAGKVITCLIQFEEGGLAITN